MEHGFWENNEQQSGMAEFALLSSLLSSGLALSLFKFTHASELTSSCVAE